MGEVNCCRQKSKKHRLKSVPLKGDATRSDIDLLNLHNRVCLMNDETSKQLAPLLGGTLMAAMCLMLAGPVRAQEHSLYNECASLENASSPDLVQFLNGVTPDQQNGDCVTWAIRKLGDQRYEPAIPVLLQLIDFRRPPTGRERAGFVMHPLFVSDLYPSAGALYLIGRRALPGILLTIESEAVSTTARENAIFVLMEMFRDTDEHPKAIAVLKQKETQAKDDKTKQKLRWATQKAVSWCNTPEENACRQAAASGSS